MQNVSRITKQLVFYKFFTTIVHLFFSVWDFDDHHQHLIDIENSGTESAIRTLTGDLLCVKEFTPYVTKKQIEEK